MDTLQTAGEVGVNLRRGSVLTLSAGANSSGLIYQLDKSKGGRNSVRSWSIASGRSLELGPYADNENFFVVCVSGTLSYGEEADDSTAGYSAQENRDANFSFSATDNLTVIPCAATLTATLDGNEALDASFTVELVAVDAVTVTVDLANGATMLFAGSSVSTVSVTEEGSSILIVGSGTANKFYAYKSGT